MILLSINDCDDVFVDICEYFIFSFNLYIMVSLRKLKMAKMMKVKLMGFVGGELWSRRAKSNFQI